MPKLSLIAAEAERLLGRMREPKRLALQQALTDLCETRWHELRGREPETPLAHALWSTTPPLADLFADLYAAGDARLDDVLQGHKPGWGMALLAMAEIGRGDAEGARLAHEPMMVFESEKAGAQLAAQMSAALNGRLEFPPLHKHAAGLPLGKALAVIAAHTGRSDLKAVVEVIRLLADPATSDPALKALRNALDEVGIRFTGIDDNHVRYTQHGREHKPVTLHDVADSLLEIRQKRLAY
jgi:hypothetical protein